MNGGVPASLCCPIATIYAIRRRGAKRTFYKSNIAIEVSFSAVFSGGACPHPMQAPAGADQSVTGLQRRRGIEERAARTLPGSRRTQGAGRRARRPVPLRSCRRRAVANGAAAWLPAGPADGHRRRPGRAGSTAYCRPVRGRPVRHRTRRSWWTPSGLQVCKRGARHADLPLMKILQIGFCRCQWGHARSAQSWRLAPDGHLSMEKVSSAAVAHCVHERVLHATLAPDQTARSRKRSEYLSPFRSERILP